MYNAFKWNRQTSTVTDTMKCLKKNNYCWLIFYIKNPMSLTLSTVFIFFYHHCFCSNDTRNWIPHARNVSLTLVKLPILYITLTLDTHSLRSQRFSNSANISLTWHATQSFGSFWHKKILYNNNCNLQPKLILYHCHIISKTMVSWHAATEVDTIVSYLYF